MAEKPVKEVVEDLVKEMKDVIKLKKQKFSFTTSGINAGSYTYETIILGEDTNFKLENLVSIIPYIVFDNSWTAFSSNLKFSIFNPDVGNDKEYILVKLFNDGSSNFSSFDYGVTLIYMED